MGWISFTIFTDSKLSTSAGCLLLAQCVAQALFRRIIGLYSLFLAISCQLGESPGHPACSVSSGLWDNKVQLVIKRLKSWSDLFESLPKLSIIFCLSTIAKVHLFITMTNNPHVHSSSDLLCNCFAFLKRKTNHQSKARCKILIFKKQTEENNSLKWTMQNVNQLLIQHDKI